MDWIQFLSATIGQVLSWPVAAVIFAFVFRGSISNLVSSLKAWRNSPAGDFEFGQGVEKAENAVEAAVESLDSSQKKEADVKAPDPGEKDQTQDLTRELNSNGRSSTTPSSESIKEYQRASVASSNPSFLILSAWERLSEALLDLAGSAGILNKGNRRSPVFLLNELANRGVVNIQFVNAAAELRNLRNSVAHGQHNPTAGESLAYADSVDELTRAAQSLAMNLALQKGRGPE